MSQPGRQSICYVVSSEMTVRAFLPGHIAAASERYDVSVVANSASGDFLEKLGLTAAFHSVAIARQIAPWSDLKALLKLFLLFREQQFDMVHSVSPKAGLLAMLAGWLAGTECRIHIFTGQVWANKKGWKRCVLKQLDRLLAGLATHVLVDSPSQRDFLLAEGVVSSAKANVIGVGSICGVDAGKFKPDTEARRRIRHDFGIPESAPLLLFLGRLHRDKGIADLIGAFGRLLQQFPDAHLLLVGPDEGGLLALSDKDGGWANHVIHAPYTDRPEHFMAAADVFCLPSYREGFGMVVIEAAAAGVPAVASRIYGVTDAIEDGETGLFHEPGDAAGIASAVGRLLENPGLRYEMGEKARSRAVSLFSREALTSGLMAYYAKIRSGRFTGETI